MNKQLAYGYDEDMLTHQPRVVYDTVADMSMNLYWDANGNLQMAYEKQTKTRILQTVVQVSLE